MLYQKKRDWNIFNSFFFRCAYLLCEKRAYRERPCSKRAWRFETSPGLLCPIFAAWSVSHPQWQLCSATTREICFINFCTAVACAYTVDSLIDRSGRHCRVAFNVSSGTSLFSSRYFGESTKRNFTGIRDRFVNYVRRIDVTRRAVSHPKVYADGRYVVSRQEAAVAKARQEAGFPNAAIPE